MSNLIKCKIINLLFWNKVKHRENVMYQLGNFYQLKTAISLFIA